MENYRSQRFSRDREDRSRQQNTGRYSQGYERGPEYAPEYYERSGYGRSSSFQPEYLDRWNRDYGSGGRYDDWQQPDREAYRSDSSYDSQYDRSERYSRPGSREGRSWEEMRGGDSNRGSSRYAPSSGYHRPDEGYESRYSMRDAPYARYSEAPYDSGHNQDSPSYRPNYGSGRQDGGMNRGDWGSQGGGSSRSFSQRTQSSWRGPHSGKGPKGYKRSDEAICEDVNQRLEHDGEVDASDIEVSCSEGIITLKGTVDERSAKRAAEECASNAYGVKDVMNNLSVKQQSSSRGSDDNGTSEDSNSSGSSSSSRSSVSQKSDRYSSSSSKS